MTFRRKEGRKEGKKDTSRPEPLPPLLLRAVTARRSGLTDVKLNKTLEG
jgi:hypothetical protein